MGQLTAPIMTPLGVVYRSLCANDGEALNFGEWAVKLFGGTASRFDLLGPNAKGFYEAAIQGVVPANAKSIKPANAAREAWQDAPARACVLYDDTETPLALYFLEHEVILKPKESPPLLARCTISFKA